MLYHRKTESRSNLRNLPAPKQGIPRAMRRRNVLGLILSHPRNSGLVISGVMVWFPLWQSFHTEEHDAAIAQEGIIIKREKPYRHIQKPFRAKLSPRACTCVHTCKTSGKPHYPMIPSNTCNLVYSTLDHTCNSPPHRSSIRG